MTAAERRKEEPVPSFLFILFADIFFVIFSILEGGIFRGWLAKKKPTET